jgi:hypothetical protein
MASQNLPTWFLCVRCLTFSAISWLSSIIPIIAFAQAILSVSTSEAASTSISQPVASASISMVFADRPLLADSITLPLFSLLYLTFYDVQRTLSPNVYGTIANPIPLLFSILMSYGWLINVAFWTHCEIYKAGGKVCPPRIRLQEMSTAKVFCGWMITVVFFIHTVVTAMEILDINRTAQLAGKARLCGKEVAEGDDNEGCSIRSLGP